MTRITRLEVIDENGRSYVSWEDDNDVSWQFQDDGRTLKVFVNKVKQKSPAEEAYKEVYGWYPPTTPSVSNYEDNRWSAFQNGYNTSQKDYKVGEYEPTSQEPEELKTLYQMWNDGECRDDICYLVKIWMSQYADNVMCGEYKKGYEYCLLVLEENLK
jgi:hypothetical protein